MSRSDMCGNSSRGRLFGTDGIRGDGRVLTPELAVRVARAAVAVLGGERPRVLIIGDTRESTEMLALAAAAGVMAAGGDAFLAGVLPTPAASMLLLDHDFDLAVVVSASHNPFRDNGLKLFGADGHKLSDTVEDQIEAEIERQIAAGRDGSVTPPASIGCEHRYLDGKRDYLRALRDRFGGLELTGMRVVLDCANGAAFQTAPEIFRGLGADVTVLAQNPDGRNINDGCGATEPELLRVMMLEGDFDIGFAFDGDGDRLVVVDRDGNVVDGDDLIALLAGLLHARGCLQGNGVAVTQYTNLAFDIALRAAGIRVARVDTGDRYVLAELVRRGWCFGGESSGHIIYLPFGPSGDATANALLLLRLLGGADLTWMAPLEKFPQARANVSVRDRQVLGAVMNDGSVQEAIADAVRVLGDRGRTLVRASGTEPLARVMVEAPTAQEAQSLLERLVDAMERAVSELEGNS